VQRSIHCGGGIFLTQKGGLRGAIWVFNHSRTQKVVIEPISRSGRVISNMCGGCVGLAQGFGQIAGGFCCDVTRLFVGELA
jgi:hypothetical protein